MHPGATQLHPPPRAVYSAPLDQYRISASGSGHKCIPNRPVYVLHPSFFAKPVFYLIKVLDLKHYHLNNTNHRGERVLVCLYRYSLGLHKGCPSYRRSLQPSKENIQHFKTWNFLIFSIFAGNFALLDPDPDPLTWLNPYPIRIRIRNAEY